MPSVETDLKEYDPQKAVRQSIQAQARPSPIEMAPSGMWPTDGGMLWVNMGRFADEIPAWTIYPGVRDYYLRNLAKYEPMMASALYSMKTRMVTLGYEVTGPKMAQRAAQEMLNICDFGRGLISLLARGTDDLMSTDNGLFIEKMGAGNPLEPLPFNLVTGFNHLDSRRCYRSFDPEYPVIYDNPETGALHNLHYTRVAFTADNPQPIERARGIGLCAVSRALQWVRIMRDTLTYREEKIAGRFTRAIGIAKGINLNQLTDALNEQVVKDEAAGYIIYRNIPILAAPGYQGKSDAEIMLTDLASLPDGFVFESDMSLYAYVLAFAFGVDAREFWPATASGATKADASVQNQKARGRGIGALIRTWETVLRQCLPETVEFTFDFTDDEQDAMREQIQAARVLNLSKLKFDGAITAGEERALAIADGILDPKILETAVEIEPAIGVVPQKPAPNAEPTTEDTPKGEGEQAKSVTPFSEGVKSLDSYAAGIRAAARGLWQGILAPYDFINAMNSTLRRGLSQAWYEGAAQCGIQPEDLTETEVNALQLLIFDQIGYVPNLAEYIMVNNQPNGGKFADLDSRLSLWINRYNEARNLGQLEACADQKLKWIYGDTIKHCPDCSAVEGRVYRASVWHKYGWRPQSPALACSGLRCDCDLVPTDEPVTKGRPPAIRGVKEHAHTH